VGHPWSKKIPELEEWIREVEECCPASDSIKNQTPIKIDQQGSL